MNRKLENHLRIGTIIISCLAVLILALGTYTRSSAEYLDLNLKFPFTAGPTWKVIQGYNTTITHSGYQKYSFDYARDDGSQTAGNFVFSPLSGYVVWGGTSTDPQGCISVRSTASSNYRVMLCHIIFIKDFKIGDYLSQGYWLGKVAPAGQKGNRGVAHIHITLYYLPSGSPDQAAYRQPKPFNYDNGWSLDKANFPAVDTISNTYLNLYGLCSSQYDGASVRMNWVVTTDGNNYIKYVFRRSDAIKYFANVTNYNASNSTSFYDWRAFPISGSTIMSWAGNLTDPPGSRWWNLSTTVTSTADQKFYTYRVQATYAGVRSCRVNVFRVVP